MKVFFYLLVVAVVCNAIEQTPQEKELLQLLTKLLSERSSPPGPVGNVPPNAPSPGIYEDIPPAPPSVTGPSDMFEESVDDFLKEKCGLDMSDVAGELGELKPVTVAQLQEGLQLLSTHAKGFNDLMADHGSKLEALEDAMQDENMDIDSFGRRHEEAIANFLQTLIKTVSNNVCIQARTGMLLYRMEIAGGSGFKSNTRCNQAGTLLLTTVLTVNWHTDEIRTALAETLDVVGQELKNDVKCMINDVKNYQEYLAGISKKDFKELTMHEAALLVETATSYLEDISEDSYNLYQTSYTIGILLDYYPMADKKIGKRVMARKTDSIADKAQSTPDLLKLLQKVAKGLNATMKKR